MFVDHYAIQHSIPKTNFMKHGWVKIKMLSFRPFNSEESSFSECLAAAAN